MDNGEGKYKLSSYVRLAPDSSYDTVGICVLVSVNDSDGSKWFPGEYITINKTDWTLVDAEVDIKWSGSITNADFYFATEQTQANAKLTSLAFDDISLVKLGASGDPTVNDPTKDDKPSSPKTGDIGLVSYILMAGIAMAGTKFAIRKR